MLQLLYILAFTILAFLAVGNLIRNMMTLGVDSQRSFATRNILSRNGQSQTVSHPELLDISGNMINEPYLVMRSMTVEDAREQLDALYKSSPGASSTADQTQDDL